MLVGYMRVSTSDDRQSVDMQRDALAAAGVDKRHLHLAGPIHRGDDTAW